jgi:thiol-disulfide isomerase/thioredoxin
MKGRLRSVLFCSVVAALGATVGFVIARMVPADLPMAKVNLAGEHSAAITVTRADGSTAAGEPWTLRFLSDGNVSGIGITYGNPPRTKQIKPTGVSMDLTLSAGIVPEDGVIELRGLPGGENTQMLHLFVGRAGYLGLSLPDDAKTHESFSLQLPADLKAGDQAPPMEVVRVSDSTITTLPSSGKVAYLEFWGVHCGPCQEPLAQLDDLARRRGKEWQSRVQLASICLDPINDVRRHVATHSLKHADHFIPTGDHPAGGTPNPFGVLGVPRAFLIDATGRIVWAGHPAEFDVEREIESLLMD